MERLANSWLDLKETVRGGMKPQGFPVLLYHALAKDDQDISGNQRERKYWVSAESLRQHLEALGGHRIALLEDLWTRCPYAMHSSRQLAITFDDGHRTDYTLAFPLLQRTRACATFFINTATVTTAGFLTWAQIFEMERYGMSFQSHGHDHLSMARLSDSLLRLELRRSKEELEGHLGRAVRLFAAPYGEVSDRVLYVAREVGYEAVCTTRSWPTWPGNRFINRICMYETTSAEELSRLASLDRTVFMSRTLRSALLYVPRRIFPRLMLPQLPLRQKGAV